MMRILLASTYYGMPTMPDEGYGGIEKVNWFLARELQRLGHDVTLYASHGTIPPEGVSLLYYQGDANGRLDINHAAEFAAIGNFDIIHDSSHEHLLAKAMPRQLQKKCLCTFHNPNRRNGAPNPVVLSLAQLKEPCDYGDAPIVYNGVPPDFYRYYPQKERYVLCMGVMLDRKGVRESVDAALAVDMPIHLAGINEDGVYWSHIRSKIDGEKVIWHGMVRGEKKIELLGKAMAVMMFMKWPEPGSLLGPEAMACGTPIVASDKGCMPEYVLHGATGFICKDLDEIISSLRKVDLLDPLDSLYRWRATFNAERMANDYVNLYNLVLQGKTW